MGLMTLQSQVQILSFLRIAIQRLPFNLVRYRVCFPSLSFAEEGEPFALLQLLFLQRSWRRGSSKKHRDPFLLLFGISPSCYFSAFPLLLAPKGQEAFRHFPFFLPSASLKKGQEAFLCFSEAFLCFSEAEEGQRREVASLCFRRKATKGERTGKQEEKAFMLFPLASFNSSPLPSASLKKGRSWMKLRGG